MTDKELGIHTEEVQIDGTGSFHCHRYEPTSYEVLEELFYHYTPMENDVIVDYGCGLGRLNFYVENRFSLMSTGVELADRYYTGALKNRETYLGDKEKITFVQCAAQNYEVAPNETVFYFFNPFSISIFRQVMNRILLSWQEHPRVLTLILYYPEDDVVFYIEQHTSFALFGEFASGEEVKCDRRERFCLYRLDI